ncbi:MAG: DNA translocase FtsK 4TM domain-containing protein [Candidatus Falkowbacteria bacterium]
MAKRKYNKNDGGIDPLENINLSKVNLNANAKRSILVVFVFILGLISLLGLFNLSGQVGSLLSKILSSSFGWGRWIWPLILMLWAWFLYKGKKYHVTRFNYLGLFLFLIAYQSLFHFFISEANSKAYAEAGSGGGYVGLYLSSFFTNIFGFWGGLVFLVALFFVSVILILNTSLHNIVGSQSFIGRALIEVKNSFAKLFSKNTDELETADYVEAPAKLASKAELEDEDESEEEEVEEEEPQQISEFFKEKVIKVKATPAAPVEAAPAKTDWKTKKIKIDLPLELLSTKTGQAAGGDIERNSYIIKNTLEQFGIPVDMAETSVGPTVTQYTFKPSDGIKLSRITDLANNLSLALAAHPIRIEAPIPGKALVGIEVPNKSKAVVGLREILEDKAFKNRNSNLMVALGKDVSGENWLFDITKMPHLLVAGATNSGKSVCLNTIIVSLLYQNGPENLRFIMVDPKRVELPAYNGIPHLLTPVITEVPKTINALKWCMNEMDRRYDILNKVGKKNIQSYNDSTKEKMPYIIFVIDELADLMVAAAKDIEGSIIRLTQMSRAVGIHLILATQRPSVDVITGLIKANVPARIAFSVASAIDSKTILDSSGAEKLLGKGDMLFSAAGLSKPKRIQGALVDDDEITAITDYIKEKNGPVEYLSEVVERQKVGGVAGIGLDGTTGDEDELLQEAKEIVIGMGRASTSLLQRRLRIGYGRAASILDYLEEAGLIGPSNGSKPREILISKEQYEQSVDQQQSMAGMPVHSRTSAAIPNSFLGDEIDTEDGNDGTLEFESEITSPVFEPEVTIEHQVAVEPDDAAESDEELEEDLEGESEEELEEESGDDGEDDDAADDVFVSKEDDKKDTKHEKIIDDEDDGRYFSK